ncbi:AzlD domain-containing protein [Desulfuromonas sp. KJ2020]|uniref:AzlD domain-containing protein n=1 Tax=Desulfuromonas sp. KJ2020 TaxID=2919173 RepID=UPI0020A7FE65|nr:AzlD domain-containing protein [Desulfuromonas sp. KJ2020]MCP3175686.1 AzlD domain-containing protein [Desulfuromonas sp. KJ2020]
MSLMDYLLLVAGMGAVTYIPRWLPLFALAQRRLPQGLVDWLRLIPVAILSALVAPALLADSAARTLSFGKPEFWVAIPTLFFAWRTRSLAGTVIFGMFLFWLAGKF